MEKCMRGTLWPLSQELRNCCQRLTSDNDYWWNQHWKIRRRRTYFAAAIDGFKRKSSIYVGDSIVRKSDA